MSLLFVSFCMMTHVYGCDYHDGQIVRIKGYESLNDDINDELGIINNWVSPIWNKILNAFWKKLCVVKVAREINGLMTAEIIFIENKYLEKVPTIFIKENDDVSDNGYDYSSFIRKHPSDIIFFEEHDLYLTTRNNHDSIFPIDAHISPQLGCMDSFIFEKTNNVHILYIHQILASKNIINLLDKLKLDITDQERIELLKLKKDFRKIVLWGAINDHYPELLDIELYQEISRDVAIILQEMQSAFGYQQKFDTIFYDYVYVTMKNRFKWTKRKWKSIGDTILRYYVDQAQSLLKRDMLNFNGDFNFICEETINEDLTFPCNIKNYRNTLIFYDLLAASNVVDKFHFHVEGNDAKNIYIFVPKERALQLQRMIQQKLILQYGLGMSESKHRVVYRRSLPGNQNDKAIIQFQYFMSKVGDSKSMKYAAF